MPRALLSVYDKTGLIDLARGLAELGWELIASGGTAKALSAAGLKATPVEQITGAPEMLGGRVKTLHPAIHAAILARDTDSDRAELAAHGYQPIDLVVCNLYPFQETVAKEGITLEEAVEQIDIGGVTLLRAAAKNFARVTVLCDPADYGPALAELRYTTDPEVLLALRKMFAVKALAHTSAYDAAVSEFLSSYSTGVTITPAPIFSSQMRDRSTDLLPKEFTLKSTRLGTLRYGENPHQQGAFYALALGGPLGGTVLGGKALSYNNMLDLDAAWRALELHDNPTVVIVKHLNPCGIASSESVAQAFPKALACDPVSAFGGVIAVNRAVDDDLVTALVDLFVEAIAAPEFTESAQRSLGESRKNCRLLRIKPEIRASVPESEFRSVRGGVLLQTIDRGDPAGTEWKVVSKRQPTSDEMEALRFAWKACQAVKSNAIVLAVNDATVGIGGGLSSRVDSARLAVEKAGDRARGAVMASDAFFPFPDAVEVGIRAGVTAIVQPGGSVRDEQAIAAVDAVDVAMVFTGVRHFRH